ncbi:MAG: polysaccharide biosynthesis C-terminal domain-containing protein [Sphingobacteriales bacterium]|nr:polysaccharide biosynthesis C-terminal domain-containing protein [Sphingobacteriales bacterium]
MGVMRRQGLKSMLMAYIGVVLGAINVLAVYPACLTPELIGLSGALTDSAMLLLPTVLLGSTYMGVKFFPNFNNTNKKHNGFLGLLLLIPLFGFAVFALIFPAIKPLLQSLFIKQSPLFSQYIVYLLPLLFLFALQWALESWLKSLFLVAIPSLLRETLWRLLVIAACVLYFYGFVNQHGFVIAYIGCYAIVCLCFVLYVIGLKKFYWRINFAQLNKPLVRQMATYSGYIILAGLGVIGMRTIDALMITSMSGLHSAGVYRIAFFIGTIIEIPYRVFTQIASPLVASYLSNKNITALDEVYKKVSINQFIVGLLLLLLIALNLNTLFKLMPNGQIYAAGWYVVLIIGAAKVIDSLTSVNNEIIVYSDFYRISLLIMLSTVAVTIISNLVLIPLCGITGAAIATLATITLFNFLKLWFIYYKYKIQPFSKQTVKVLGAALISAIPAFLIPQLGHYLLDSTLKTIFLVGIYSTLIWKWNISPDINMFLISLMSKIKQR